MNKKISIILPAYNCENTIESAINSILSQTYENWELVIVNDGSTDMTTQVLSNYVENSKIIIINQENLGPSVARNVGIASISGEYVAFIDSDDYFDKNYLETMCRNMENNDLVICNYRCVGNNMNSRVTRIQNKIYYKKHFSKMIFKLKSKKLLNANWNKLYKKEIITKYNITFDKKYNNGEDIRFNYEYLKYINKVKIINDVLYNYFQNTKGLTASNNNKVIDRYIKLMEFEIDYFINNDLDLKYIKKQLIRSIYTINSYERIIKDDYICLFNKINDNRNLLFYGIKSSLNSKRHYFIKIILKFIKIIKRR